VQESTIFKGAIHIAILHASELIISTTVASPMILFKIQIPFGFFVIPSLSS